MEFVFRCFVEYMETPPRFITVKRHPFESSFYQAMKRVFGCGSNAVTPKHIWPHIEQDAKTISFCPYGVFEELREKFAFLQREDRTLYNLITGLPFESSIDFLNTNLRELQKVRFN